MSHEIDTMAYVGETPWHKLGVNLGGENVTAKEMVAKAGLDWTVQKQPIHFMGEGKSVTIPDNYAIVRTDRNKALGVVGSVYTPLQNAKAFEFMDEIIGEGRAAYHTAGSLMGGRRVWVLVDMKNEAEIVPGDTVKSYALLTNGHDGRSMVDLTLEYSPGSLEHQGERPLFPYQAYRQHGEQDHGSRSRPSDRLCQIQELCSSRQAIGRQEHHEKATR